MSKLIIYKLVPEQPKYSRDTLKRLLSFYEYGVESPHYDLHMPLPCSLEGVVTELQGLWRIFSGDVLNEQEMLMSLEVLRQKVYSWQTPFITFHHIDSLKKQRIFRITFHLSYSGRFVMSSDKHDMAIFDEESRKATENINYIRRQNFPDRPKSNDVEAYLEFYESSESKGTRITYYPKEIPELNPILESKLPNSLADFYWKIINKL